MNIAQSSPLYEYWKSDQEEEAEKKRLLKVNSNEPASTLFRNEPYKWENLYQSVVRNVIRGDESSVKGLMVLLATINKNEKNKSLMALEELLDDHIVNILRNENYQDLNSSRNFFSSLKILLNIFINPYGIKLKNGNNHIYEKTGMFFYKFRKIVLSKK